MLAQYSAFIAKAREFTKAGLKTGEAVTKAVKYCL
jgi:hypothetical protein